MRAPTLHIVMPVLNEAAGIEVTLQALAPLLACDAQLTLADGGSADATVALAHASSQGASLRVLNTPQGRARQMNAGAHQTGADVLLFLHADTQLPPNADGLIARALKSGDRVWGRFDVRITGRHWLLPVIAACMNIRSRWTGISTGDQAMFMTRTAFEAVGGFADQPLMEDIDMSMRLLTLSRPACLRAKVLTSGRRWEAHGVWRTVLLMWRLRLAYWWGVTPAKLAVWYR